MRGTELWQPFVSISWERDDVIVFFYNRWEWLKGLIVWDYMRFWFTGWVFMGTCGLLVLQSASNIDLLPLKSLGQI